MSDDLVSKMRAAVDQARAEAAPAEEAAAPEPEATEEPAQVDEAPETKVEAEEPQEEAVEAQGEDKPEEPGPDEAEDILVMRRQAERRVAKAEAKARDLEAKLAAAIEQTEKTRGQVAEDIFKKLRRKPIATFKEFGMDFQDLIDAGIRETNGQDDRVVSEIDELRSELRELKREREEVKLREQEQATERQLVEARNEFLDKVTKKQFPTLYNLFEDDPDALWQEAQRVAEKLATGDDYDIDDIEVIQMLEEKYKSRLKKVGGLGAAPAEKKPQPKTLTTKAASEVRSAGKPFGQLSVDEQKAALNAAVKQALVKPN